METSISLFKFSRAGKVIFEEVSFEKATRLISDGAVLQTDYYWASGMNEWKPVSSRSWAMSSSSESPPPRCRKPIKT